MIADARHEKQIIERAKATDGVADATPLTEQGRPGSGPTRIVDGKIRVDGADALVGGYTAQQYDTQTTAERDRMLIVPVVLAIILIILVALLRSVLLPLILVATVALNLAARWGFPRSCSGTSSGSRAPMPPCRCTGSCSWWRWAWTPTSS